MRLAKYLAHSGVASRRAAEKLIANGRVTVGGETVTDPARDVDETSGVAVDGGAVRPESRVVYALNKPPRVVSTVKDPGGHPTVVSLVPSERRLYPVGRLDFDSTGLILLTNDGDLANRLMHPRYEVPKTYRPRCQSRLSRSCARESSSRTVPPRRRTCAGSLRRGSRSRSARGATGR
jgi:23S rRNA pseudouridine2605 synthase